MKELRIVLTGGGSGGHIFPLLAVAQRLQEQADNFGIPLRMKYCGPMSEYAQEIVDNNIDFSAILSGKLRRYWSLLNLIDIPKLFLGCLQALWKLFWFMPDAVFSKGGPGSLAVVLAAKFYFIPIVIHESDSIPGLTNKISGALAKKIFLAFASAESYFKGKDIEIVGNPIRKEISEYQNLAQVNNEDIHVNAKKNFGFDISQPVLLILGGSQGAEKLNSFVLENLSLLLQDFQVLHQVGARNYQTYKNEYQFMAKDWGEVEKTRYHFQAFFEDIADALAAADIVISRAGSGSIFELAAMGKPAVLVPLNLSANDHQKENATIFSQTGAAIIVQEENLLGNLVLEELKKIIQDKSLLEKMGAAAQSFYRPEAALVIAKHLMLYV